MEQYLMYIMIIWAFLHVTAKIILRGLCFTNEPEAWFTATNSGMVPLLQGLYGYQIQYNDTENEWQIADVKQGRLLATLSNYQRGFYPVGLHTWTLQNTICNKDKLSNTNLSLSICSNEDFMCDNGDCILKSKLCNAKTECIDGSDETQCG